MKPHECSCCFLCRDAFFSAALIADQGQQTAVVITGRERRRGFTLEAKTAVKLERERRRLKGDDLQIRNHFEVTFISGTDGIAELKSGDADQQICKRNDISIFFASASILAASCAISFVNGSVGIAAKMVSR